MSEMTMSPADISAMCNNGCGGNGYWNNPFMYLIWYALFRNGGFGGDSGNLQGAEIQGKLNALSSQIADNQNTNTINAGIMGNHDFLHNLCNSMNMGFAGTNATINNASMQNVIGQKDQAAQMASCCCDIKSNILNQTNQLQSQIAQLANGVQTGFANIGFLTQSQTNELSNVANANTQRILDKMCNDTTQSLRDKLWEASQQAQTASIVSQLKTSA